MAVQGQQDLAQLALLPLWSVELVLPEEVLARRVRLALVVRLELLGRLEQVAPLERPVLLERRGRRGMMVLLEQVVRRERRGMMELLGRPVHLVRVDTSLRSQVVKPKQVISPFTGWHPFTRKYMDQSRIRFL